MNIIASWIDHWFVPLWVLFFIVVVGYFLGEIKIGGISMGLSAVLIVSLLVGVLFDCFPTISLNNIILFKASDWVDTMQSLSPLGSALFLSTVGMSAGSEFALARKRHPLRYAAIGAFAVISNFIFAKILFYLDGEIDEALLHGIFCGAMTSTPGLSSICEVSSQFATQATVGYGSSYLFGVMGVVLFIQFCTGKKNNQTIQTESKETYATKGPALYGLFHISFTIIGGIILGSITLPATRISLGTSGGILIFGLVIGYFTQKKSPENVLSGTYSDLYRNLGLILFFVGNGILSGMQLRQNFIPYAVVYGILLTIFPILFTYFVCRYFLKQDKRTSLSILCGSMTSTPAFGVLTKSGRTSVDFSIYTSSYTGALITMVILLNFFTSKP